MVVGTISEMTVFSVKEGLGALIGVLSSIEPFGFRVNPERV